MQKQQTGYVWCYYIESRISETQAASKGLSKNDELFFESIICEPVEEVVKDFRKTDLYTDEFLKDTWILWFFLYYKFLIFYT